MGDGVNLQPSYFCNGDQDIGWDSMGDYPDIRTVRIEIEPPSWGESQATLSDARRWIDEANDNGYEVIATCHHYPNNGSNTKQDLLDAAQWWTDNYSYLSANSSFTVNLHNEWGSHDTTRSEYADAYNDALGTVRDETDYSGPIVCDIPGYAQEYQIAADAAGDITDDNVILSGHVYPSAWNSDQGRWVETSDLDDLDDNDGGYPCMIGEFGSRRDGDADWSGLVDHASSLGWPVLGWAWNGDGEDMNMMTPFWGDSCASSYSTTDYFSTIEDKLGDGGDSDTETQYLNAEYHTLDGVTTSTTRSGYWGDSYVTEFHDSGDTVTVSFDSAASGDRAVKLRYASEYGDKKCELSINGTQVAEPLLEQTGTFRTTTVGTFSFDSGTNTITVEKGWGYYDIDCIIVDS
ncbi:CBM35 domain-containing protein [Halorhabdus amylolytica]|uniref:CBM35 domain-containing protein n=1 Tax=Halorhabdus amylolytica TaxID=2559573 RepID=UPI001B7D7D6A|nr:CBM35 domain-containing protein [Halorhabdus amylolytica]